MTVGEQENSLVSFVGDAGKESPRFVEPEELDRLSAPGASGFAIFWRLWGGRFLLGGFR